MPTMRRHDWLVLFLALGLPGLLLAPVWRLGAVCAGEDDLLYYYPSRVWLHELATGFEPPYLNPWNGLDRPLLADPQSAVFYPTTWLFAILPASTAYPVSLWLHYSLALFGMFRLLRAKKLAVRAALFGAIAFAFCGFLLAHRAHFTIQHAAAWLPIVFWRLERFHACGGRGRFAIAAGAAALQCYSGHFQISALTALGTLVYLLATLGGFAWRTLARWAGTWIAAGLLFAVQLVPTLAYVAICNRGDRGVLQFLENSWNPLSVIGLFMPMFFGQRTPNFFDAAYWGPSHQVEQFCYSSILVLFLALAAFRADWQSHPLRRPFGWLAIVALIVALGQFTPVGWLLYMLPGASLFRVPARAMLLLNFALAALGASVLHDLAGPLSPMHSRLRAALLRITGRPVALPLLAAGSAIAVVLVICWIFPEAMQRAALLAIRPWTPIVLAPVAMSIGSLLLLRRVARHWTTPPAIAPLMLVLVLDLGIIGWTIDVPRSGDPRAAAPTALDERWGAAVRDSESRLWVLTRRRDGTPGEYVDSRAKLAANTNILSHIRDLTDYGPLTPRDYDEHFPFKPWGEAEPLVAGPLLADSGWMRDFDVGWVLLCESGWPAPAGGELYTTTDHGYRLFRMPPTRGRVYPADPAAGMTVEGVDESAVRVRFEVRSSVDRVRAESDGAASRDIFISRLALPGWDATLNGAMLPVTQQQGMLAIRIPIGARGEVLLRYEPPGLVLGAATTAISASILVGLVIAGRVGQRAGRAANSRGFSNRYASCSTST